jgi:hypothetical protein
VNIQKIVSPIQTRVFSPNTRDIMYYHAIFSASLCNDSLLINIEQKIKYTFTLDAVLRVYIPYKDCPTSRHILFEDTLLQNISGHSIKLRNLT